ncbi:MAG TPA: PAS domain-containing protein [Thermoleophilaceae bacterium]|nr:PAS domain-containing protein [Thermoleophilaceae bacterium]
MAGDLTPVRLIHEAREARGFKLFCGRCGFPPGEGTASMPGSRVCASCGLGLLLEASEEAAPTPADAFLVVDSGMTVKAVSQRAERLLQASESHAVGRRLTDLLSPADADARATQGFLALVLMAATGASECQTIPVRPAGEFGIRYWARVSSCGPRSAALVVLSGME